MDFAQAALLVAGLLGITQLAKTFVYGTTRERVNAAIVLVASTVATLLVAQSDWASTQVVGDKPLSTLNFWSLLLVAVFLAGASSTAWELLGAVKNVGENQPLALDKVKKAVAKAGPDVHEDQGTAVLAQPTPDAAAAPTDEAEAAAAAAANLATHLAGGTTPDA